MMQTFVQDISTRISRLTVGMAITIYSDESLDRLNDISHSQKTYTIESDLHTLISSYMCFKANLDSETFLQYQCQLEHHYIEFAQVLSQTIRIMPKRQHPKLQLALAAVQYYAA